MARTISTTYGDRGVSPVIGVILMVAITVILAAVIGTFAVSLGGQVQPTVKAGVNVEFDESRQEISVAYNSYKNSDFLNVSLTNQSATPTTVSKFRMEAVGDRIVWDPTGNYTTGAVSKYRSYDSITLAEGREYRVIVTAVSGDVRTLMTTQSGSV